VAIIDQGMAPSAITPTEEYHIASHDALKAVDHTFDLTVDHGAGKAKQLIGEALKGRIEVIDHDVCQVGEEDAFFVADLGEVYRQHLRWKKNLARVKPHFGEFDPSIA
jgi:ornithine decarboxylase